MKLFIWQDKDTLPEYGSGLVVAFASGLQEALRAVNMKAGYRITDSFNVAEPTIVIDLGDVPAMASDAWYCYGSA